MSGWGSHFVHNWPIIRWGQAFLSSRNSGAIFWKMVSKNIFSKSRNAIENQMKLISGLIKKSGFADVSKNPKSYVRVFEAFIFSQVQTMAMQIKL
jgi:hypothetical protein